MGLVIGNYVTIGAARRTPAASGHNVGDIAYWDGSQIRFVAYARWRSSLGTPVGVCFIPTSHAVVWGDGKARFLAVTGVKSDGSHSETNQGMSWDGNTRSAGLTKRTKVPTWDNTVGGTIGSNANGYISSDKFDDGVQNVVDSGSKYKTDVSPFVPSPYAADGSFNEDYRRTISGNNVLADFAGKTNTATIVTALGASGGQAAKACNLYSSSGISAGEWYLPAAGELAYIMPRFSVVNAALLACGGTAITDGVNFWSSTEITEVNAYYVATGNSYINSGSKYFYSIPRPVVSIL